MCLSSVYKGHCFFRIFCLTGKTCCPLHTEGIISRPGKFDTGRDFPVFPVASAKERKALKKLKKVLDKGGKLLYYTLALRRQQVAQAVIPAEDINNILIVFVSLRLYAARAFFMSVQSFVWR